MSQQFLNRCSTKNKGENCEVQHEECETGERCFKDLNSDRLIESESLKFCQSAPDVNLKLTGGVSETEVWPWMYEISTVKFKTDENGNHYSVETFCVANQIGRDTLITGKVKLF